jgi:uncharacterized protein (DUF1778 family)
MDERYPSHKLAKFQMRYPEDLRDLLRAAAARNNRSLNAEIVSRLGESMNGFEIMSAEEAVQRAEEALKNQEAALRNAAACAIRDRSGSGFMDAKVYTHGIPHEAVELVSRELQKSGYGISVQDGAMFITFAAK